MAWASACPRDHAGEEVIAAVVLRSGLWIADLGILWEAREGRMVRRCAPTATVWCQPLLHPASVSRLGTVLAFPQAQPPSQPREAS